MAADNHEAGNQMYDVCVIPHWDVSCSWIESFTRLVDALQRHAQIVNGLRESGWTLARERMQRARFAA